VFTGRDAERGRAVAERTGSTFVRADAASEDDVNRSVDEAVAHLGGLDALVCNAGVIVDATISQTSLEDWQTLLDVNLTAPYLYSVRALPALRDAGGGSIVHVSSDAGVWGEEDFGTLRPRRAAAPDVPSRPADRIRAPCAPATSSGMATTTRGREEYGTHRVARAADGPHRRGDRRGRRGVVPALARLVVRERHGDPGRRGHAGVVPRVGGRLVTDLRGRRALVTGGTSGIGRGIVARLTTDGASVVFTGRDAGRGADVEAATGAGFLQADAADPAAVVASAAEAMRMLGGDP
jgi:NAD(P)-dependent dehydrogenase (short-subunit alcohol dehydrogenase family)